MKVLMTLMGLEIGGAETHVVELSKALTRKGYEVVIASNGGVYQKELEEYGIRHIKIPLHSKKPWLFLKSYFALSKLFKSESFDIVHAHARIPAFITGLLVKKYNFRFVTTAHWVFKITPLWKRLANWGEKTIAVSDDIKEYLIDNYGICSDNISTTINGIDTNKFSKSTDWSDIANEFGLSESKYRILYVSRMDEDRSAVAYQVAEAMPELLKLRPNAELVIVGDGNDFDRLKAHTDRINSEIGHKAIILTGGRVDINKFVAASDVFVGVSRSALEAMASGMPVVIAGNEGYIGIFDVSKFRISYDTNYCCRGCCESTTELIKNDLIRILSLSEDELTKMRGYNKNVIETYYSADKMAQDYADMYQSFAPLYHYPHGEVIINGYYGYKNIGDDALLQAMIDSIRKEDNGTKITVLSASPKETSVKYAVNSIHRYNIFRILNEMRHAKLFISGGGSLLQDITSTKSLVYYTFLLKLAQRKGLKTMVYANGFGPICKKKNIKRIKKALINADYISMREPESARALSEILPHINISTTADPAFSLSSADEKWVQKLLVKNGLDSSKKYFALSLRTWQYSDSSLDGKIANYCNKVYKEYGYEPVFITMQNDKDKNVIDRVSQKLNCNYKVISKTTAGELLGIMKLMAFSVGMRLHFLIFSAISCVPMIGLSYDPKIDSLINYIGCDAIVPSDNIDEDKLFLITNRIISQRDSITAELNKMNKAMIDKNRLDSSMAIKMLNNN